MSNNIKVLVVGAGVIAQEYIKVLLAQRMDPIVVTRGEEKAKRVRELFPQVEVITGGIDNYLSFSNCPDYSIVATPIEFLADATSSLIKSGCKNILVEKPLTLYKEKALEIDELAKKHKCRVVIAFNRRSYQSVLKAKELIDDDGGVSSFHFDFTEAIFRIAPLDYNKEVTNFWGIANSSHVIDTAFYLGGKPNWMECKQYGNMVKWHSAGSIFTGIGETVSNVPFTYHSNWGAPGKWNIEIMTPKRKLIFSPMERLKQQPINSFVIEEIPIDYSLDIDYKPGFFVQVEQFLKNEGLFGLDELSDEINMLNKIFKY